MIHTGASAANVVGAYIDFVGRVEQEVRQPLGKRDGIIKASRHLGESCRLLTIARDNARARESYQAAQVLLQRLQRSPRNPGGATMLSLNAAVIAAGRHPEDAEQIRTRVQVEAAKGISVALGTLARSSHNPGHFTHCPQSMREGSIAEKSMLCALVRIGDPRFLTLAALPHHDDSGSRDGKHGHFDLSSTIVCDAGLAYTQKWQVKMGCFYMCEQPEEGAKETFDSLRRRYANDVGLLSGCCDLGLTAIDPNCETHDFTTGLALAREAEKTATDREVARLNKISNHLLGILINPEGRTGLLPSAGAIAA